MHLIQTVLIFQIYSCLRASGKLVFTCYVIYMCAYDAHPNIFSFELLGIVPTTPQMAFPYLTRVWPCGCVDPRHVIASPKISNPGLFIPAYSVPFSTVSYSYAQPNGLTEVYTPTMLSELSSFFQVPSSSRENQGVIRADSQHLETSMPFDSLYVIVKIFTYIFSVI